MSRPGIGRFGVIIAKETGTETGLRSLLRSLLLLQFRIRDLPSRSRCLARKL